ncbi:putative siderophore transport system ATP-binding protein YusV [Marinibacterium anthonyi]|nr:putative siderophore transport system ATP-binding protein YusV [Marinibacterium anthonyi]
MIRITDLSLSIHGHDILRDVSADVPKSGITALIGPNGAGKSSLLHCVAGLTRPTAGTVWVDGLDMSTARDLDRARTLAILTQSQAVSSRLTVEDLVGFGRWPHHQGRITDTDRAIVDEALAAFALTGLRTRYLDTLSGGQRQRAFVAMTHAQATGWLLLDEPLNALDPRHAHDLMSRLYAMSRPGPDTRAVVIVVHDLNAAAAWADRVIAMKDGRIAAAGPRDEVLTEPLLTKLFDTPFGVHSHADRLFVFTNG